MKKLLQGQVVVGQYSDGYRLRDGTGVQTALVLDALYGQRRQEADVRDRRGAVTRGTFRLWAPTAHRVSLLTWPAGSAADAPASAATRSALRASRTARGPHGPRDRQDVPLPVRGDGLQRRRRGKIETNLVTDPYSVALTLDSTRSVAVDLDDRADQPAVWRTTPSPKLARAVDSTIYELHVRDFSINDKTRAGRPSRLLPGLRRRGHRLEAPAHASPRPA